MHHPRHCEERSDVAIRIPPMHSIGRTPGSGIERIATGFALAMTRMPEAYATDSAQAIIEPGRRGRAPALQKTALTSRDRRFLL